MAEERLIDDDKDRKYRFRKNEDGEEELELIGSDAASDVGEDEPEEYGVFEVPEFTEDDEDAVNMSPEQLYIVQRKREEERKEAEAKAEELLKKAEELKAEGQDEYALVTLDSAQNAYDGLWQIYPMKLELLTKNFTDFSRLDECGEVVPVFEERVPEEERKAFSSKYSAAVKAELESAERERDTLMAKNEEGKAERRAKFKKQRKTALLHFLFAAVPFVVFLCLGIGFSTVMFSDRGGTMLVLTIVFFALAAVALIAAVVLARPLARAGHRVRVNENNSATALGRSYLESSARADKISALCKAVCFDGSEGR